MTAGRFSSLPLPTLPCLRGRVGWGSAQALVVLVVLLCAGLAVCAVTFPRLTDRVVDEAHILSDREREALSSKLAELETKSGIQLVVATANSLQGQEIEPYANELLAPGSLARKRRTT